MNIYAEKLHRVIMLCYGKKGKSKKLHILVRLFIKTGDDDDDDKNYDEKKY